MQILIICNSCIIIYFSVVNESLYTISLIALLVSNVKECLQYMHILHEYSVTYNYTVCQCSEKYCRINLYTNTGMLTNFLL